MPSFSQFNEDYILCDYLEKNKININQFVVEIGAAYPELLSNSRYFISKGYKALLVEPTDYFYNLQKNYHQDNKNVTIIQKAISDKNGNAKFNVDVEATYSGISDTGIDIETVTLKKLLSDVKMENETIGVLSIDVEGYDNEILKSILNDNLFPQVIIIEANNKAEREKHFSVLQNDYTLIAETGRGFFKGQTGMFLDKVFTKIFKKGIFQGPNTIWLHNTLIK